MLGTERTQEQQVGQQGIRRETEYRAVISVCQKQYRNSVVAQLLHRYPQFTMSAPAISPVCRAILRSDATPCTPREARSWG